MSRQVLPLLVCALAAGAAPAADLPAFGADVRPLLARYCAGCHNADRKEGGIELAAVTDADARAKTKLWRRAKKRVAAGEMPPADAKVPLADADKATLLRWLTVAAESPDCGPARRDPGPPLVRRLTRAEYDNTVHDLLGVPINSAEAVGLPDDKPPEGHFDTLASNLAVSPALMDKYFAAADAVVEKLFGNEWYADGARKKLFVARPDPKLSDRDAARQVVTTLARRAFRRPAGGEDVNRLLGFYDRAAARGASYDDAIRAVLKPVLVSPQFLLRIEKDWPAVGPAPGVPVDDHELAVRLSYFLWATMPDAELFKLADQGRLAADLDAQVRRMLKDPRARALTDRFAAQWLHLDKLATARPTTEFFPAFNGQLRRAMHDEVTSFVDHLRTEDLSVLDLLDADYTFANEPLAKHYGLSGVAGDKMRKVALKPTDHRGGLLGMGAVLALTSHTFRTSPTQRGKYVLEVVLGTPPPPPPPNVSQLKDDMPKGKKQPLTFKEQLAQHATQANCAGCHRKIDPLGFALDNYNAVGAWRESTKDNPLDTAGVLPTGEAVNGVADLKKVLLVRKDEFAKNLAGRLLEYALGRELDAADECTVRDIHAAMQKDGYKFSVLVVETVKSVPFRQRRAEAK